ncbi:MAG: VWA domain-containing protein [Planctomycetota bacterium]|jgi:Ca-activated chloride channel family protein
MTFHQPSVWLLLLLVLLPLLWWRRSRGRIRSTIVFSSIEPLQRAGTTWAVRLRWVVTAVRDAALVLLIVCVARPQKANERTRVVTEGIAIQLVVDRSISMLARDFELDGREANRLDAVKKVVREFIDGGDKLPGRPDDLIGMITFASHADSRCPLTLDHGHLLDAVDQTNVSSSADDLSTAIGDAVALGVERMAGLTERPDLAGGGRIKSKVMILLTDGEHNAGDIDPITAAKMAAAFDIKLYTIGAGTDQGFQRVRWRNGETGREQWVNIRATIDEETLAEMAEITGGRSFRAHDSETLQDVYARIDELERTEIEQQRYSDFREMSVEAVHLGRVALPPLLSVVVVLLALNILLANTRFRTLP